ncbi:efflux RND transporter periplasmic adaptor subunit [Rhizobiaceae bacterium CRRU44]|uniref:Efflux RND transporter periplasmic adaptor subunit n=1 Tax=Ferranicluibacter rubi TaxID=2715133 RepID=A0AA43ZKW8_9HYPH|nr:efflux RND transporter periplasmic adaptor subunit [Ferranicluibacter rubi]
MNQHIERPTKHTLSLAETLGSLSLELEPAHLPPRKRSRRFILAPGLLMIAAGLGGGVILASGWTLPWMEATAVQPLGEDSRPAEPSPGVAENHVSSPIVSSPAREITGSGFVIPEQGTRVFSKYEGRVVRVAVEAGDLVTRGQALVVLEDRDARFGLEQAQAAKTAADLQEVARRIDLVQSETERDRMERLFVSDAVSRQVLDLARVRQQQAENAAAQGRQSVESADISLRMAQDRLDEQTVSAPFAGVVTGLSVHVGDTVLARADSVREDQSLLTLTDMDRLAIDADVAEANIATLKPGLVGEAVLDAFPDQPFRVAIRRLAPVASVEKGTVTLRLDLIDPPKGLRPNMAARIRIPITPAGDIAQ